MKTLKTICLIAVAGLLLASCGSKEKNSTEVAMVDPASIYVKGTITAELTAPPFVPAPVGNRSAKKTTSKHGDP